jgi:hypothetical protein
VITAEPLRPGSPPAPLRVATIPHTDAYVAAVLPDGAVRVGDDAVPSPWLEPAVLTRRARDIDVLHVHASLGHLAAAGLECWTETVRRAGVPLVVTVHQLRPHAAADDARLAALLSTAEVVLTPTAAAADEIADRFGRTAIVVAYPSLDAPDPELGAERGLVGLRLGPPSSAVPDQPVLVRGALSGAVSGGGRLRVLAEAGRDVDPGVWLMAERGEIELVVHPPGERPAQLQQLHVAVLPERCGSHSRDLETCRDVGTRVVAPRCGWFAGQWSEVVTYGTDERGGADPVSLTAAVAAALTTPMPRPADRTWRAEQRAAVVRVHAEVYAQVAADRIWT